MKLHRALFTSLLVLLSVGGSPARADMVPVLDCAIPADPSLSLIIARDSMLNRSVAIVSRDGRSSAAFEMPMSPAMTAANGALAATYSAHNFVLTINANDLAETDPAGIGFAAFQIGATPLSFEVSCAPSAAVPLAPTMPEAERSADPLAAAPEASSTPMAEAP